MNAGLPAKLPFDLLWHFWVCHHLFGRPKAIHVFGGDLRDFDLWAACGAILLTGEA
jgi:hypothetical protein